MNKKLLIPAIISITLQLLYIVLMLLGINILIDCFIILAVFYLLAVPYTIIWFIASFKQYDKKHKLLHSLCVLFTFPLLFIGLLLFIKLFPIHHEPEEIDPDTIHVYDAAGEEVSLDSIAKQIIKDSIQGIKPNISQIHIDED